MNPVYMSFSISIVENAPISEDSSMDDALKMFLTQIGYLKREKDTDTAIELFKCFVLMPNREWTVEGLISQLKTTRPTLYNHLNKLKSMDLIEGHSREIEGFQNKKKVYSLRSGNLERAWHFVEYHIEDYLKNYRRTVESIWNIAQRERVKRASEGDGE